MPRTAPAVPARHGCPAISLPADARRRHETWLKQVTGIPTAAGREQGVIAYVEAWCAKRDDVTLTRDKHGNLMLKRKGARSQKPIWFTAHLDHPAFVVREVEGTQLKAEFRGGVRASYFVGTSVRLYPNGTTRRNESVVGTIDTYTPADKTHWAPTIAITLQKPVETQPGDVLTWDLAEPEITQGMLHTPACDDLAAVAAGLAALETCLNAMPRLADANVKLPDVRLLLTRAEEIGFIGAIGAAKDQTIPKGSRLLCLENSKSFAESPIGGGPIVRVGDKTATFTSELTFSVGKVAEQLEQADESFVWQRKLMAGGTCEATAFHSLGYTATCLCLPLGNYHNMNENAGKIDREKISIADYHALIRLLVACALWLDAGDGELSLAQKMENLFAERSSVL